MLDFDRDQVYARLHEIVDVKLFGRRIGTTLGSQSSVKVDRVLVASSHLKLGLFGALQSEFLSKETHTLAFNANGRRVFR